MRWAELLQEIRMIRFEEGVLWKNPKCLSPVAWTHVNFQGRYEFLSSQGTTAIDAWLTQILINEKDFKTG